MTWISVTKKMPNDRFVLAYCKDWGIPFEVVAFDSASQTWIDTRDEIIEESLITHWMELPASPVDKRRDK